MTNTIFKKLAFIAVLSAPLAHAAEEKQKKSGRPDVYTTSVYKLKGDVSFENAKKAFDGINVVLSKTKGFEKRNVFYDKEQKLWIDQIKWKHADVAKSGLKTIENDPAHSKIMEIADGKPTAVYQAERVTEVEAKDKE